jgi:hypothetical protein
MAAGHEVLQLTPPAALAGGSFLFCAQVDTVDLGVMLLEPGEGAAGDRERRQHDPSPLFLLHGCGDEERVGGWVPHRSLSLFPLDCGMGCVAAQAHSPL